MGQLCNVNPPPMGTETISLYSATNSSVTAYRYGNVVNIAIFNVPPSILQSASVTIPTDMRCASRIDTTLGWIWNSSSGTKILLGMLAGGNFMSLNYFDASTGTLETATDSQGNVFANLTYVCS